MPFASCFSAAARASIVPGDSGCDGTQSPEIRSFRFAVDPPYGFYPHSLPRVAWQVPLVIAAPLPAEAIAGAAVNLPESPNHRKTGILNSCPPLVPSDFFRSFQHLVYLIEIEITEQR